ncbi:acyl-CoA dehydrogenase family protein, partial [Octadecabacter sp.]|nr:acyl-CoA dehydrogenase family protein [Octadecabacter sp.]
MPTFTAPTKDQQFILHDVLTISEMAIPGYGDLDRDFTDAVLTEAGKLASEVLAPLNMVGDNQGCTLENGVVRVPDGFKDAYDKMAEGGWMSMDIPEEFGGQGLPHIMHTAAMEPMVSANMAFQMYPGLTHGNMIAILAHGTDEQKA